MDTHPIAVKVHKLIDIHNLGDVVYKFAGIVKAYANLIDKEAESLNLMPWQTREILHSDPLIRVCVDHMVRITGGNAEYGCSTGYGVLFAMIEEGMRQPCPVRMTRLKDIRPDKQENNQPGNDLYADTPYDGGEHVPSENSWLFLNCDPEEIEDQRNAESF